MRLRPALLVAVVVLACANSLSAQTLYGTLVGNVTDETAAGRSYQTIDAWGDSNGRLDGLADL